MNDRIFAIGDLHGHFDELIFLLDKLQNEADFNPFKDHLVLLGDLVDTGPKVNEVVNFAWSWSKTYPDTVHVIKGNHEDLLLDAFNPKHPIYGDYYLWWNQGGRQTLKSYTEDLDATEYEKAIMQPKDYIPDYHLEFLATRPLYWETDKYFFCHGGVRPGKQIKDIDFLDPEVQKDLIWIRDEFYMSKFDWGKKVVFGHSPFQDVGQKGTEFVVLNKPNLLGINTMPRNFGHLTAVELPAEKFYTSL